MREGGVVILMTVFTASRGLTTMVPSNVIIYGVLAIFQDTPIDLDINDTWPFVDIVVSTSPCASHKSLIDVTNTDAALAVPRVPSDLAFIGGPCAIPRCQDKPEI
ncbi:uncharacterized protein B0T23DRAFT_202080 [Neurospora hispaniola]|uniref:Uncharacterized protein n=1 Tax=Neurospora hispaniola TaxID=588809 RepID=A0AAJ0MPY9_9PEZI|nr:hypothetical protein B0T23DRAFT_202080 [Neurospora hispaniola]